MGAAAIPAIGIGIQGTQAIGSGIKGARGAVQADERMTAYDDATNALFGHGSNAIETLMGAMGGFNNPALAEQILEMSQGAASSLGDIFSGAAGAVAGIDRPEVMELLNFAAPGIQDLMAEGHFGVNLDHLMGRDGQGDLSNYGWGTSNQVRHQAMTDAEQFGIDQRATATEQAGRAGAAQGDALNAMLAGRGISPDSGVAAEALSGLSRDQSQQMVELNRALSDDAARRGLDASMFDVSSALQRDQMGSQYNLGMNQIRSGHALGASQLELGMNELGASYNLGIQGLQQDSALQEFLANIGAQGQRFGQQYDLAGLEQALIGDQTNYATQGQVAPIELLQGIYGQNYRDPFLGVASGLSGLAGTALQHMGMGLDLRNEQNQQASAGKGAATGGMIEHGIPQLMSSKETG